MARWYHNDTNCDSTRPRAQTVGAQPSDLRDDSRPSTINSKRAMILIGCQLVRRDCQVRCRYSNEPYVLDR